MSELSIGTGEDPLTMEEVEILSRLPAFESDAEALFHYLHRALATIKAQNLNKAKHVPSDACPALCLECEYRSE